MNLAEYLRDFNQEYLGTPEDRRQFAGTLLCFILTGALIIATGVLMLLAL